VTYKELTSTTAPAREAALSLLKEYLKNEGLLRHALAVEAVMAHFAGLFGEDREKWSVIGLVHDIDYEMYPDEHCLKAGEILRVHGWPADYIRSVQSHGWKICTEIEPVHRMEKVLYAIDELTGLIAATVYMRPDRNIAELEVSSVKKKWKQKSFAAGVNRQVIEDGAALLGMELDRLIAETINGMRQAARELGLSGKE
jgi:putative nucleotidyltransferase with HDIG domain